MPAVRPGQIKELYKWKNKFIVVSTVSLNTDDLAVKDFLETTEMITAMIGPRTYASSGEETMAFNSDDNGKVTSWTEIAVSNGYDSRNNVLRQLEEMADAN